MRSTIHPFSQRQQMIRSSFEIHHYKDAYISDVAMHHHDFYEIYFFVSGKVSYRIESHTFDLQPGDILLISPLELHQPVFSYQKDSYERVVLWVNKTYLEGLSKGSCNIDRCFDINRKGHVNLMRLDALNRQQLMQQMDLLLEESEGSQFGSQIVAESILTQILVQLNRFAMHQQGKVKSYEQKDPSEAVIAELLRYINENVQEEMSLDDLAQRFFISKYHLSREFRRLVGTSLYRYIIQKRLILAKQRLLLGENPTEVYCHCGFGDYSNFYRAFKAEYGIGPKEFTKTSLV